MLVESANKWLGYSHLARAVLFVLSSIAFSFLIEAAVTLSIFGILLSSVTRLVDRSLQEFNKLQDLLHALETVNSSLVQDRLLSRVTEDINQCLRFLLPGNKNLDNAQPVELAIDQLEGATRVLREHLDSSPRAAGPFAERVMGAEGETRPASPTGSLDV